MAGTSGKPEASKPKFMKPSDHGDYEEDKPDLETNTSTAFVYNPHLAMALEQQRQKLPIYKNRDHILYLVEKYQTLVLIGETGCGKSTQVPQFLMEAGWCANGKIVGISEPRRVAATSLAARVAEEVGSVLGETVGYTIRFDDCTTANVTKIKYMTEGILMREMMGDPLLRNYSVILVDEVHERTLNTDILMGLLKKIIKKRRTLRLVISSATVDAERLRDFFNMNPNEPEDKATSTIMSVQGRQYPVSVFYLQEPCPDYVQGVVETVWKLHNSEPPGDILAFVTGQDEVDRAVSRLKQYSPSKNTELELHILPMYGSLLNSEQLKVFRYPPKGMRKAVIATNIAETSITIQGINYVIDCGYCKLKWFDSESRIENLVVVPISRASAEQRAGRAGRHRPGCVYRLYTEESYNQLERQTRGEMERCELSGAVLQMKALGIDNVLRFNFPVPPPAKSLVSAYELLHALGAISSSAELTEPLGLQMAEFPLSPLHAKALLSAHEFGCTEEMLSILALLQVKSVFVENVRGQAAIRARVARRKFEVSEGDLVTYLNVFQGYMSQKDDVDRWAHRNFVNKKAILRAHKLRDQMASLLKAFNVPILKSKSTENICKCIASGFFTNAAYLHTSGVYKTLRGDKDLYIHPSSLMYTTMQPQWVVFCETVHTHRLFMREITVIQPQWLHEFAPHFYHTVVDR